MFDHSHIQSGHEVFGSDDQKIGSVHEVGPSYFEITTGFLGLGPQLFIPFDAVTNVDGDRVYLDVSKDEIDSRGWDQRPAETVGAGQGMYGTMPSATAEAPTESWVSAADIQDKMLYDWEGHEIGRATEVGPDYV